MIKKILLRSAIAVAAVAVAVAFVPRGSVDLRGAAPVAIGSNATTVVFNPAANPAFKVNGFTACATGRTGHLWTATTITATSVKSTQNTESVHVVLGGNTYVLPKPNFTATVPVTDNFNCSDVSGNSLSYTATSWDKNGPQNGGGTSSTGNYDITKVD